MDRSLYRIILKLVEPDRERRYAAATDVVADLKRLQQAQQSRRRRLVLAPSLAALLLLAAGLWFFDSPDLPVTSPSEYTQITNFTDSAVAPSLSPDGRMVTFIRGRDAFLSRGQIYVKLLPNGEAVRLTNHAGPKYGPVFTPDGSRIAYTRLIPSNTGLSWDTSTVPVLGGEPSRFLPNASGLTWIGDRQILFAEIKTGLHMGIVTSTENRAERREIYFPANERAMAHYANASPDRQSVLVVEMNGTHHFSIPCRLLPFDGSSAGRPPGDLHVSRVVSGRKVDVRESTAGCVNHQLRHFARRTGGGLHDNGQQWIIADLARAPRPAHTASPDCSSRRSSVLWRRRRPLLPVAGAEHQLAGPS
ncbi:MAG: PD40 domain-containing protein [Acidobacteria bacterium]|nr:PD40 domain-containing protein [Acidobacteriota bacterium]